MYIRKNDRERNIGNHKKQIEELGEWFNKEKLGLFYFKSDVTESHMFLGTNRLRYSYIIYHNGILGDGYVIVDQVFNRKDDGGRDLCYCEARVKIDDLKLWLLKEIVNNYNSE